MMSISTATPTKSSRNSSDRLSSLPDSPSTELALTLAGIKLNDDADESVSGDGISLSAILEKVEVTLGLIKEQFFVIQERRHAGVFTLVEKRGSEYTHTPTKRGDDGTEKSVALDEAMAKLNALFEDVSENMKFAEGELNGLNDKSSPFGVVSPRKRTSSIASLSSLDSFDDAFNEMNSHEDHPSTLKKRFEELSLQWANVQSEAKTLEEELSGDKYLLVFTSICEQMEGMMESLEKALASCHDFVFTFHKDRAGKAFSLTSSPGSYTSSHWSSADERLAELKTVKRSFDVKKSSYGPACEQMFVSLEKGVKQRSTQNGTILRTYSEMKTRWRVLRERVSKMDKELKQIEAEITSTDENGSVTSFGSPRDQLLSPNRANVRPKSRLRDKNDSATNTPTHMSRSISIGDLYGESKALSPSDMNSGLLLFPSDASLSPRSPPAKPPKSVHRRSLLESKPSTATHTIHSRSVSSAAALVPPVPNVRSSSRPIPPSAPNRYSRAGSEPPNKNNKNNNDLQWDRKERPDIRYNVEPDESLLDLGDSSIVSVETTYRRPASVAGMYNRPPSAFGSPSRPPSAAGSYYRPPASATSEVDGNSRIPRLATGQTPRKGNDGSNYDRPGSAMSYASSTAYGKSPSAKTSYTRSQYPPSSFHNNDRGNRLSMQTPEPTIAARAQRMNLFAPRSTTTSSTTKTTNVSSKRSSRPPPAKYNASVYGVSGSVNGGASSYSHHAGASSAASTASTSPTSHRTLATTKPLNINKRNSTLWSANGRTTPLSAAALAKIPNAMPGMTEQGQRQVFGEAGASSVSNFRSQRTGMGTSEYGGAGSYSASVRSGRDTPTYSEGGGSSVWGGGARRMANVYSYRANPNDALDIEVANIVNSLGMAIDRVDPPLPRGVKEMNPSSSKTVKYEVGGKVIVCKLLQLHRPASVRSNEDKTNKVLTRVGGGWIDLRQYLLSRLGTA